MNDGGYIHDFVTTAEAARILGVSRHQVVQLVRSGFIRAIRPTSRAIYVNVGSVYEYKQLYQGKGRPLTPSAGFAALWLLSGKRADWLDYPQLRRTKGRLRVVSAEKLAWNCRLCRGEIQRYATAPSVMGEVADSLALTGVSSSVASDEGLTGNRLAIEGYLVREALQPLVKRCHLFSRDGGQICIHVVDWLPPDVEGEMPAGVVALDLASMVEARARSIGLSMMRRLLDEYRASQP